MTEDKFTIKQWAEEDRPREKMLQKGVRSLSNAELLAILIGSGNRTMTAVDLSKKILNDVGNNLKNLGKKTIAELIADYNGVGEAKAITILAAMELGRRRQSEDALKQPKIEGSQSVADIFQPLLSDLSHEEFWVLYLSRSHKVISSEKISQGGVSGTVVDVKLIFKPALEKLASAIILCHNHPSGNKEPSSEDVSITRKCVEAGKVLSVNVLDHIIISHNEHYSFADNGLMPQ
ncbi:MAG: DNA repair protein RadC [Bacteroidales bacterium]|jgi:DNA repair protein RadC|nr:DNA repair protein RadC [Bacteroidales bacterium]